MSSKNQNTDNVKKNTKQTKQQKFVRLVCFFLAALMILSCVSVLAYVFGSSWNVAADSGYAFPSNLIAVGLECGKNEVAVGFEVSTTNGFVVNSATIGRDERYVNRIYSLPHNYVYVVNDANLSKHSDTYTNYDGNSAAIGGYHLEIKEMYVDSSGQKVPQKLDIPSEDRLREVIADVETLISGSSYNAIPCYIDNRYVVRVGDFSTADNANNALASLGKLTEKYNVGLAEPSASAVSIIDPNLNKVLFEFDCFSQLGISATTGYLKTYDSRLYGGTLCYKRADGGVQVTSLVDFEEYVCCVVPFEIGASWNYNAITAFSIVVRSYALRHKCSHFSSHNVDVYDDATDQVYGGYSRVTDKVITACNETKGLVAFWGGTLASLYYSSSTGGYVVGNNYVWGSAPIPYLATKATPWENYVDRGNGLWEVEVSPTELAASLREVSSCANLSSPIASVTVNSTAGESGYVTSITFVDTAGNQATVGNTASKVKSALYDFVYSANFVVGKGSVECNYNVIRSVNVFKGDDSLGFVEQYPGYFNKFNISDYNVMTANGQLPTGDSYLSMLTHVGRKSVTVEKANVLTAQNYRDLFNRGIDIDNIYNTASEPSNPPIYNGETGVTVDLTPISKTVTASNAENFVFAGKGWGHGVGMSQYGVLDLANAGMAGTSIIKTYFEGVTISHY